MSPIIIISGGRGGSTWVQDALAKANGLRTIFEPLHPDRVPGAEAYAFAYIREDEQRDDFRVFLERVIDGRIGRLWTQYRINRNNFWLGAQSLTSLTELYKQFCQHRAIARRFIRYKGIDQKVRPVIKFIRANLMLGWLRKNLDAMTVLLLRHPCAVVESKLRLFGNVWRYDHILEKYLGDPRFREDYLSDIDIPPISTMSKEDGFATIWCIETMVALDQARRNGVCVTHFEPLLNNMDEWRRVTGELGLEKAPTPEDLVKPSQQAGPERRDNPDYSQGIKKKWMYRLTDEQIRSIEGVLNRFKIKTYSVNEADPIDDSQQLNN